MSITIHERPTGRVVRGVHRIQSTTTQNDFGKKTYTGGYISKGNSLEEKQTPDGSFFKNKFKKIFNPDQEMLDKEFNDNKCYKVIEKKKSPKDWNMIENFKCKRSYDNKAFNYSVSLNDPAYRERCFNKSTENNPYKVFCDSYIPNKDELKAEKFMKDKCIDLFMEKPNYEKWNENEKHLCKNPFHTLKYVYTKGTESDKKKIDGLFDIIKPEELKTNYLMMDLQDTKESLDRYKNQN